MFVWPLNSLCVCFTLQDSVNGHGWTSGRCILHVNHYHHRRWTWYSAGHHHRGWSVCLGPQEDDTWVRLRANQLRHYGTSPAPMYTHSPISDEVTDPLLDDKKDHTHVTDDVWMCLNICTDKLSGWKYHDVFFDLNMLRIEFFTSLYFKLIGHRTNRVIIWFCSFFLDMMLVCSVSHNTNNNNNPACIISYLANFKNINFSLILKYMQMFWEMKALMEVLRDSDFSRFSVSCSSDDFRRTLLLCCKLHFVNIDLHHV